MSLASADPTRALPELAARYLRIRRLSERIVAPLTPEDCLVQSMPDVSPLRWHLAHTTWFFETFVLEQVPDYEVFDEEFRVLFNSYYNLVGDQFPRPQRGLISRPGMQRVLEYRRYVDEAMERVLRGGFQHDASVIDIGLHHEQQHQELMLTDIKHVFSCNPTLPVYEAKPVVPSLTHELEWVRLEPGLHHVGYDRDQFDARHAAPPTRDLAWKFSYDNELPRHQHYLHGFEIANRPVTCGEWIQFIEQDGYRRPDWWLSLGWTTAQEQGWNAPLYWLQQDGEWFQFTLGGLKPVDPDAPVCHLSYLEADAFARWSGARLPTEFEWEHACFEQGLECESGQFADICLADDRLLHPASTSPTNLPLTQMLGGVWEWTSSSYSAYPGYRAPAGALGEYNGKFMCNQYVLRGGSVATSRDHLRPTYRNFFPAETRWQFSGLRLARDLDH